MKTICQTMSRVSVVVPVYNTKDYLSRCLNSILRQTYKNLEIILVDDGSYDGSEAICDAYAVKDMRIRTFHIKNSGVSAARNYALKKATGDYITFVDADDLVDVHYIERLLDVATSKKMSVVTCCAKDVTSEEVSESWTIKTGEPLILSIESGFDYTKKSAHTVVWGGYTKKRFYMELFFYKIYRLEKIHIFLRRC